MGSGQHVLVLLSGGIDSAVCAATYVTDGHRVSALFVDYGQSARSHEARAAQAVALHLKIPLKKIHIEGLASGVGYVHGRNALLVQLAATAFEHPTGGLIAIGLIDGAHYIDCTPTFVQTAQRNLDLYFDGRVQLVAPLIDVAKPSVLRMLTAANLPIELTYSCEAGTDPVCGRCLSCRDRASA